MKNARKLDAELRAAGIPIDGCSSNGTIWFRAEATEAQKKQAQDILAAHDPADTRAQRLEKLGLREDLAALFLVASRGDSAPEWARSRVGDVASLIEAND